jgi:acyl carrier protein
MVSEEKVVRLILDLLADRGIEKTANDVQTGTVLYGAGGIGLDSLDMAVLSSVLEREFGSDPFSQGIFPRTVAEILAFYAGQ